MKASILFITYQHEKFVVEAIRSAMAEGYQDIELVICDDGSTDSTRILLERELKECPKRISIVWGGSRRNRGLHANFNDGLALCSGDIIVAMSGDDISMATRVSLICTKFAENPMCMLVTSNWNQIDQKGESNGICGRLPKSSVFSYELTKNDIYATEPVHGATAAYRSTLRNLFPPMDQGRHSEDTCYFVRALLVGEIHYLPYPLVLWRTHQNNLSNWVTNQDDHLSRARHLRSLHTHQLLWRQWQNDFSHAHDTKLISDKDLTHLQCLSRLKCEYYRLLRLSVTRAPWSLWLYSASKLVLGSLLSGSFVKSVSRVRRRHFPLRFSKRHHDRYWRSKCGSAEIFKRSNLQTSPSPSESL